MNDFLAEGRRVLFSQPFSCLLGADLISLSKGEAELQLDYRQEFQQSYGFVHGGVISYMADNCLTFAGATMLGNCVTSEFKINYLQPVKASALYAKASVLSVTLRQAVCECKVYMDLRESKALVASAQGTIVKIENDTVS